MVAAACIVGAFVFGTVLALLRGLLPALAKRLGVDEARAGNLLAALHLALFPMMLAAGALCDRWQPARVLSLGALVTAVGLGGLTVGRTFRQALLAVLLVGAGGAGVSAGSILLMPRAFWPDHAAASLNLGNVFFGLGALLAPTLTEVLFRTAGFRKSVALAALVSLVPALLGSLAAGEAAAGPVAAVAASSSPLASPTLWLAALVFFLYGPLEWSVAAWASGYLAEVGYLRRARFVLAGFWLSFLATRFFTAVLQRPGGPLGPAADVWLVCFMALAAAVVLGNLAGAHIRGGAAFGLVLLGAAFGPIFPTLVGVVFDRFPEQEGTAYGAMFAVGSLGGLFVPPLIARVARRHSVRFALRVPAVLGLLLALAALLLALWVMQDAVGGR